MKKVPFSPPDITESEVNLVSEALRSQLRILRGLRQKNLRD